MILSRTRSLTLVGLALALAVHASPTAASARRWAKAMKSGTAAYEEADFARAEKQFRTALKEALHFDLGDPRAVQTLIAVGNLYRAENKLDVAEGILRNALVLAEVWRGPTSPEVAATLNALGALDAGPDAESLLRQALAMREKLLGLDHPEVAATLRNLGELLMNEFPPRYTEAEPLLKRTRAIEEKALGPDDPAVASTLEDLGVLYTAQGRCAEAAPLEQNAVAIFEHSLRPDHPYLAGALQHYAALLRKMSREGEADVLEARAFSIAMNDSGRRRRDP